MIPYEYTCRWWSTGVLFPMCPSSQWVPVLWTMCSALLMLIVLCGLFKRPVMMWRA